MPWLSENPTNAINLWARNDTDHLNTPRQIYDEQPQIKWRSDQGEPFGAGACNPDPDRDNVLFEINLRFPGPYFDRETNQHYTTTSGTTSRVAGGMCRVIRSDWRAT